MEHKIGEVIKLPDGGKAEVVECDWASTCADCFLYLSEICDICSCRASQRSDHKDIIYKEVK